MDIHKELKKFYRRAWWSNVLNFPVRIVKRLKRMWDFLKFGWNYYPFDTSYANELVAYHLREFAKDVHRCVGSEKNARRARVLANLFERVGEGSLGYSVRLHDAYGHNKALMDKGSKIDFQPIEDSDYMELLFGQNLTSSERKQYDRCWKVYNKQAEDIYKHEKALMIKYIDRYWEGFWD